MNYLVCFFWNHLASIFEERRIVNGKEEICLVIPTATNQIKRGKRGNWMSKFRLAECPPNERAQTHDVQMTFFSPEEFQKTCDFSSFYRVSHLGRVYEHDNSLENRRDRTNRARDVQYHGTIVLSDIPRNLILMNSQNSKRYVGDLTFRAKADDGVVFTGVLCVDDIPREDVYTDMNTGKKYVHARLVKLEKLDTYMNSHQLIIMRDDGTVIEIGRFKEWQREGYQPNQQPQSPQYPEPQNNNQKNIPDSIQGIKF